MNFIYKLQNYKSLILTEICIHFSN